MKTIIVLALMVMAGVLMTGPALGNETSRTDLEAIVDEYISACEAKSAMLNSRSENIRRDAMLACLRATFCRNAKAELIAELVAGNVSPKKHTVHHYLNARFNAVVGARLALK
jgi:hypothetical protein